MISNIWVTSKSTKAFKGKHTESWSCSTLKKMQCCHKEKENSKGLVLRMLYIWESSFIPFVLKMEMIKIVTECSLLYLMLKNNNITM